MASSACTTPTDRPLIAESIQIVILRYPPPPVRIQETTCPIRTFFHGCET